MSKLDPELIKNLLEIYKIGGGDPYILEISPEKVTINEGRSGIYNICSACYSIIDKTWDHADWCELYKVEPVSDWLKRGKNEK